MITLAAPQRDEQEIKRSRFIATARRADTPEEAAALVEAASGTPTGPPTTASPAARPAGRSSRRSTASASITWWSW
jgi:hypothetical protein